MKKTFVSLLVLLMAFTTSNAQIRNAQADMQSISVTQAQDPAKAPNRIALDENERIMGYYTTDEIGGTALGLGKNGLFKAAVEFTPTHLTPFIGGQITKVRFALNETVGASKVTVCTVTFDGNTVTPVSEVEVPSTQVGWNDVTLTEPVTIQEGLDYLIAFDFMSKTSGYPLLTDMDINPEGGVNGGFLIYGNIGNGDMWYNNGTSYGNLCIQAVVKGGTFPDEDITVNGLTTEQYIKTGESTDYSYTIRNNGNIIPGQYTMDLLFDGEVIQTTDTPVELKNVAQTVSGSVTIPDGTPTGNHKLTVKVSKINGNTPAENTDDDIAEADVNTYNSCMPRQKSLMEEFTATTCPACPYAEPVIAALEKLRDDLVIVAHHTDIPAPGDPMTCNEALDISYILGARSNPSGVFNRYFVTDASLNQDGQLYFVLGYDAMYADAAADMFSKVIDLSNSMPAFASININTQLDKETRQLNIEVSGNRTEDFDTFVGEDAVLSVYLTEDGIVAKQSGGSANAVHNNVMRKAITDISGEAIAWNGDAYSNTYSFTLPAEWNADNVNVVAFIGRPLNRTSRINDLWVNNAETCKAGYGTSGISGTTADKTNATETARYTADGRKISEPVKGLNIIRMSDGTIRKVIVK